MRIRSTKPDFWRSKTIADALDWSDRFVLKGLEAYVDDNGVGKDDLELIATEVFPRDTFRNPRECVARLSEAISRIHSAGLIARYEIEGEKLLYVDKWKSLQRIDRPSKGRYPRPDGTFDYSDDVDRDSYKSPRSTLARPRDTLASGTGEQGNRGTGEQIGGGGSLESHQGGADGPPPEKCLRHIYNPNPPSCGACADARKANEAWTNALTQAERERVRDVEAARQRRRKLIDDCPICDDFGRLDDLSDCNHQETQHA